MHQNQRMDWIDFAKGVSIVLVVLFHASLALDDYNLTADIFWLENEFFSPIRMPVFFTVSGLLARTIIHYSWGDIFQKRIVFLIYIFVLWSVLHLLWKLLMPFAPDPKATEWVTFLYSPSSVLWFVWALAFYFLVAKAGLLIGKKAVLAGAIGLSVLAYAKVFGFKNYAHNNVLEFLPFFLFGAWYSNHLLSSQALGWVRTAILTSVVFVPSFALVYEHMLPEGVESVTKFPLSVLGIVVGISVSMIACRFTSLKAVPVYLGKNTLPIYVAHSPIVGLLTVALADGATDMPLAEFWSVPTVSAAAIILSLLLKFGVEKAGGWWLFAPPRALKKKATAVAVEPT
jgi:uncharacterized membrane protein YcfT